MLVDETDRGCRAGLDPPFLRLLLTEQYLKLLVR